MFSRASVLLLSLKRLHVYCWEWLRARQLRSAPRMIQTSLIKLPTGGDLRPRTLREMSNGFLSESSLLRCFFLRATLSVCATAEGSDCPDRLTH